MSGIGRAVGKVFGLKPPSPPKKTEAQKQAEEDAAVAAREQRQKMERGEAERKRGQVGRAQLSYNQPKSMLGSGTKLGA